jgi:hypothetical protein
VVDSRQEVVAWLGSSVAGEQCRLTKYDTLHRGPDLMNPLQRSKQRKIYVKGMDLNNALNTEFLLNSKFEVSSYLTGNTLCLRYKAQPVNAV